METPPLVSKMEIIKEQHTLLMPFANIIFGKTLEVLCEVTFLTWTSVSSVNLEIVSIIGTDSDTVSTNMIYLVDEDSQTRNLIIEGIYGNTIRWDLSEPWW